MAATLDDLIGALSNVALYPHRPSSVEVVQTHISVVFIAGELVYKIKKPLNLGFLDFTTLEKRRYYCNQEIVLNSRFSDNIYLKVVSIFAQDGVINLDGVGEEIETAVLMRRIPNDRILINLLEKELVTGEILDNLADRIAYFHAKARTDAQISSFGSRQVIHQNLTENFQQTIPYIDRTIDHETHEAIAALSFDFLKNNIELINDRMVRGFIRDCHGDLHLDHVVILDKIVLYDCIEFNDRFRYGDTAADIGFLLMDLDYRGYPAFAARIARRYAESSGDWEILKLVGFYKAYRAFVRGKVTSFVLDEPEVDPVEKSEASTVADSYFRLSLACLLPAPPPVLIIMVGPTGSGKSYVAARLGTRLGIRPLRSDVVRKEIQGILQSEHRLDNYGMGIYTSDSTERTYEVLLGRAEKALLEGDSVIVDASFMRFDHRWKARDIAVRVGARLRAIECTAPDEIIRNRLQERTRDLDDPSDGRWEIFLRQKERFEPMSDSERDEYNQWDPSQDLNAFLTEIARGCTFLWNSAAVH